MAIALAPASHVYRVPPPAAPRERLSIGWIPQPDELWAIGMATARYRKALLERVPPMKRTLDRDEVVDFLAAIAAEGRA